MAKKKAGGTPPGKKRKFKNPGARHKSTDGMTFGMGNKKKKQLPNSGSFKEGNEIWKLAKYEDLGREKLYTTPQALHDKIVEYFKWNEANPWKESVLVKKGLNTKIVLVNKKRVATMTALKMYLGVSDTFFEAYKRGELKDSAEFLKVIHMAERGVRNNKFEGASAGFFNANIIAQDLGLSSKVDVTSGSQPIQAPVINIVKGDAPMFANKESDIDDTQQKSKKSKTKH